MRQQIDTITEQLAILFPSHFPSEIDLTNDTHPPPENYVTETQRLKSEIETITADIASLELKQNVALMTETFRLQEELQSLRAVCHGIRMQMHFLMMERRGAAATSLNATEAASSNNAHSTEGNRSISRIRSWLDGPSTRQETKLWTAVIVTLLSNPYPAHNVYSTYRWRMYTTSIRSNLLLMIMYSETLLYDMFVAVRLRGLR